MLDTAWSKGKIDVLVNNAAGNFIAQTHKLSARAIDSILGICLHGGAYCTTGAGRRWIEANESGTVLSILTVSALMGAPFTVPSAMQSRHRSDGPSPWNGVPREFARWRSFREAS